MQEVDDELQLVHAFVVGDLGLITRLDQSLEAAHHKLGRAAAQHRLLAEEVGLGFFRKSRIEHAAARAANAMGIGEARARARPLASCDTASKQGTPRPCWYWRRTKSPGPLGAINTTSRSLRGRICLKWMLKPWAKSSVAPFFKFGATSA